MESLNPFRLTFGQYVMAVGVPFIISCIVLPRVIRQGKPLFLLLATWVIMHPAGEFLFSDIIHLNRIRYFLTPYFIAFALLAAEGIRVLAGPRKRLIILMTLAVCATSISVYRATLKRESLCFCMGADFGYAYPEKSTMDAITWLRDNTKPTDVVLSAYYTGTLIPPFAGNTVYISWWYNLIGPPTLEWTYTNTRKFYGNGMESWEAKAFLAEANISYVFYSDHEQRFGNTAELSYPDLAKAYSSGRTMIYRVVQTDSL